MNSASDAGVDPRDGRQVVHRVDHERRAAVSSRRTRFLRRHGYGHLASEREEVAQDQAAPVAAADEADPCSALHHAIIAGTLYTKRRLI